MAELDDLRVFERVASLKSFAAAARALSQPRSNVSRSIARLEASLNARLIQRTTRDVTLTPAGESLLSRCTAPLSDLAEAMSFIGSQATEATGAVRISAGIGFGLNVLADQLPAFLERYPKVTIDLDLTSRLADLVADKVDVAVRFGPLPDSSMVAVRLGEMKRLLCGSPAYLDRCGEPRSVQDLSAHDTVEMPHPERRARSWRFSQNGRSRDVVIEPRAVVNDALTIHRLVVNGAGLGVISCYLCAPDIESGRLVHVLPDWSAPAVAVNLVFPSRREMAPAVRALVDFLKDSNPPGRHWQNNTAPVSPARSA